MSKKFLRAEPNGCGILIRINRRSAYMIWKAIMNQRRVLTILGVAAAIGLACACSPDRHVPLISTTDSQTKEASAVSPLDAPTDEITRRGRNLYLNGTRYKFAGLNADTWFGCWPGEKASTTDANLSRFFGELNPHSMTRIWVYPNAYDEALMDRIVDAAERHGQFLMVTLTDGNREGTQCGGATNYGDPSNMVAHIRRVVPRYAERPTVAVWEICNECSLDPEAKPWYRTLTDEIRRQDPSSLIATGAKTCYREDISGCVFIHDLPNVDLLDFHEYDDNDGGVSHWTDEHEAIADRLGIPWFVGETGFCCGGGDFESQDRAAERLVQEYDAYLARPGNAGMLYWDFKWGHPNASTANLDTPLWNAVTSYRHTYHAIP